MVVSTRIDPQRNENIFICDKHGEFTPTDEYIDACVAIRNLRGGRGCSTPAPNCPACVKQTEKENRAEARKNKIAVLHKESNLPPRFKAKSFDSWVTTAGGDVDGNQPRTRAKKIAVEYAGEFQSIKSAGACMVFAGPPGTGKTHLAAAIINSVIEKSFSAQYTTGLDMKGLVQATYREQGAAQTRQSAIKTFIHPDLLVIDEIDLMHASEDAQLILWQVVSGRYNQGDKPTIVVSNLTRKELSKQLGERIIDRLREAGGKFVVFDYGSHRRTK